MKIRTIFLLFLLPYSIYAHTCGYGDHRHTWKLEKSCKPDSKGIISRIDYSVSTKIVKVEKKLTDCNDGLVEFTTKKIEDIEVKAEQTLFYKEKEAESHKKEETKHNFQKTNFRIFKQDIDKEDEKDIKKKIDIEEIEDKEKEKKEKHKEDKKDIEKKIDIEEIEDKEKERKERHKIDISLNTKYSKCSQRLQKKATITAGEYFYKDFRIEDNAEVSISGKVSIFAQKVFIGKNVKLNYKGNPSNLFIGVYKNNLIINKDSKISARIFVNGNVEIKKGVEFKGLIVVNNELKAEKERDDKDKEVKNKTITIQGGETKYIDSKFSATDGNSKFGIVEILNLDTSPGNISYIEYDTELAKKMNMKIYKSASKGQIIFRGEANNQEWGKLFRTIKFRTSKKDIGKKFAVRFALKKEVEGNLFSFIFFPILADWIDIDFKIDLGCKNIGFPFNLILEAQNMVSEQASNFGVDTKKFFDFKFQNGDCEDANINTYLVVVIGNKSVDISISQSGRKDNKITTQLVGEPFTMHFNNKDKNNRKTYTIYLVGDGSIIQSDTIKFDHTSSISKNFIINSPYREVYFIVETDDRNITSDRFAVRPKQFLIVTNTNVVSVDSNFTISILVLNQATTSESYSIAEKYSGKQNIDFEISGYQNIKGWKSVSIESGLFSSDQLQIAKNGKFEISIKEKKGKEFAIIDENDTDEKLRFIEPATIEISAKKPELASLISGKCQGFYTKDGFVYMFDNNDILGGAREVNLSIKFDGKLVAGSVPFLYSVDEVDEVALKVVRDNNLRFYIGGNYIDIPKLQNGTNDLVIVWKSQDGNISIYLNGFQIFQKERFQTGYQIHPDGLIKIGDKFQGNFRYIKLSTDINEADWNMDNIWNKVINVTYPAYYKHYRQMRWNDARKLCKSKGMALPKRSQLQDLRDSFKTERISGEFWTDDEINSYNAYMFRFQNNYSRIWTQSMQKWNYKSVYCVGKSKEFPLFGARDIGVIAKNSQCKLDPLSTSSPGYGKCVGISFDNGNSGYLLFDDGDIDVPEEGYKHNRQMRWNDAKKLCEAKRMKLPKRNELSKLREEFRKNRISGEFWTDDEINSYNVYMFRFQNNYSRIWTQSMQKWNYKSVYCVTDPNSYSLFYGVRDFNLTIKFASNQLSDISLFNYKDEIHLYTSNRNLLLKIQNRASILPINTLGLFDGTPHTLKLHFISSKGSLEIFVDGHLKDVIEVKGWRDVQFNGGKKLYIGKGFIGKYYFISFETKYNSAIWDMNKLNRDVVNDSSGKYRLKVIGDLEPINSECNISSSSEENQSSENNESETEESSDENITYEFTISDIGKDTISTKIAGKEFKLNIQVRAFKNISSSGSTTGYRHNRQMRWNDAKKLCKSKGMALPKRNQLQDLRDDFKAKKISGEFWTDDEINSYNVYMFRFQNNYSRIWTQSMQKWNYKSVYCVASSDGGRKEITDFELKGKVKISLVGVDGVDTKYISFENSKQKTISFISPYVSKNVKVKLEYQGKEYFSKDSFVIRPKSFTIIAPNRVTAGNSFQLRIRAIDASGNTIRNYNESNISSLTITYQENKKQCKLGKLSGDKKLVFTHGESSLSLRYSEIGELQFKISEKDGYEFAKVDRSDTPATVRYIEPVSKVVNFKTAKILVNSELNNSMKRHTYISNQLNEMNGTINIHIKAINSENQIVENFVKGCYSEDVNLTIPLEIESKSKDITMVLFDGKRKEIPIKDSVLNIQKYIPKNKIVEKGKYKTALYLNFKRATNQPINPIRVKIAKNLEVENFAYRSSAVGDLLFLYARVVIDDKEVIGKSTPVNFIYEVYSDMPDDKNIFGETNFEPHWHRDMLVSKKLDKKIKLISSAPSIVEVENKKIVLTDPDGWSRNFLIEVQAPEYLLYNKYDANMTKSNFEIGFYKEESKEIPTSSTDKEGEGFKLDILNKSLKLPHRRVDW